MTRTDDDAWLCDCGNWQEDGFHCDACGAQPPWGCPGAGNCCCVEDDEEAEEYDGDEADLWRDEGGGG